MVTDTILIDGTDVQLDGVRVLEGWDGVIDTPDFRGDLLVIPYSNTALTFPRYRAAKQVTLALAVFGDDQADLEDNLNTLFGLLPITAGSDTAPVDTTCVLTRRLAAGDATADAVYAGGVAPVFASTQLARLTLRFLLLNGQWTDEESSSSS